MDTYHIINLHDRPGLRQRAAEWFHRQWGIPAEDYLASMDGTQAGTAVPQWYVAVAGAAIIGGVGVIDNDFHRRKDLTPNVCALYVEAAWRGRGIAGQLLERVCSDMRRHGCGALYLVTDHTSFYERYGWHFLCMVQEEGSSNLIRMYKREL